jgi:enamine deaminase RidA (YjgF/YER057c/UK114 family)
VPALRAGNLVFVAGQLPLKDGKLLLTGKIGDGAHPAEAGAEAAKQCALNALAAADAVCGLDNVVRVVRLGAFVNSAPGFTAQPKVANGASDLMVAVFGEAGKHVRAAVGVNELPLDAAVEIEFLFEIR